MATTEPPPGPTSMTVTFRYPERYSEATLGAELSTRLAGKLASGGTLVTGRAAAVAWVDAGSEVMVYLDSVKVKITGTVVVVSIDLESDQTGRTPLIVTLALAATGDLAGLLAVTDDLPRGNGLLAARWGAAVTSAVWSALLGLLQDFASERRVNPAGFAIMPGVLRLVVDNPILITTFLRARA